MKAIEYRIYPTKSEQRELTNQFGGAHWIFNCFRRVQQELSEIVEKLLSFQDTCNLLTHLKRTDEYSWLSSISNIVLQSSLLNLDRAYQDFLQRRAGYPEKKKKSSNLSNPFPKHPSVCLIDDEFFQITPLSDQNRGDVQLWRTGDPARETEIGEAYHILE